MGDFDQVFIDELKTQSWALYSVGIFLIALRLFARWRRLGFKGYQPDDYVMMLSGGLFTCLIVCLNVIAQGGGSNLFPPELFVTFTQEEINERIYGSKIVIISEQAMLNLIYSIKVCMMILYTRLTLGLQQQKLLRYLAIYVTIGWIATEITFFTACRPFEGYWGVPPPDDQCTTLQYYAIVQGCFNISSDILMLAVPIPLVLKLKMPLKQKVVLVFIFSLGSFVIIAALLTKIFNLSNVWDPSYMLWYVRESSVAIYVSNLPMIWPLIREWVPFLRTVDSTAYNKHTKTASGTIRPAQRRLRKGSRDPDSSTLNRSGSLKAAITAVANYSRPSRKTSRDSFDDDMYDLEMGMKATDYVTSSDVKTNAGLGLGITNNIVRKDNHETSESQERILGSLGVQRTVMETQQPGGISVQRTIVVHEEMIRGPSVAEIRDVKDWEDVTSDGDGQTRLYDWERRDAPSRASFETGIKA
ncbi:putative UbiD family decarboxylase [Seiridium cardinale]